MEEAEELGISIFPIYFLSNEEPFGATNGVAQPANRSYQPTVFGEGPRMGGIPKCLVNFKENPIYKWMLYRGTPISGNLHICFGKLTSLGKITTFDGKPHCFYRYVQ